MDATLHTQIRQVVSAWIDAHCDIDNVVGEPVRLFDASVVASALLEVAAEIVVSGPPDHRQSFVASLHQALDELVEKKAKINAVDYSVRGHG